MWVLLIGKTIIISDIIIIVITTTIVIIKSDRHAMMMVVDIAGQETISTDLLPAFAAVFYWLLKSFHFCEKRFLRNIPNSQFPP